MKKFFALSAFVVLLILAWHAASAAAAAFNWPAATRTDTSTYAFAPNSAVVVEDSSGDVQITGWDKPNVSLTVQRSALNSRDFDRMTVSATDAGGALRVLAQIPSQCFDCDVSLQLSVPRSAHITIVTASGDVTTGSLAGPVRAQTDSGDISVSDVGGAVHVQSSSGDITLARCAAAVGAATSSGDIAATDLASDADLA
ncbi:MAG TPA: DUF4097 family beta strand repeat-containing protein, partial [Candidatus Eremiobacteraceae bacterium]|nr:DUF4097 family beta strand repeat-containing protein [Candidatus Eremiobacteraceae bacterium]